MKKFNKRNVSKKANAEKVNKKLRNKLSNLEIKPQFLIMGLIAIITIISLIYFIFLKYSPIMNFKYEGYAVSGKEITENLAGEGKSNADKEKNANQVIELKNMELVKIGEEETIFKKLNKYYVGNKEKKEIDLNYPIYINDKSTIYNLSQDITLISQEFEEVAGYPNISISDGKVYNGNSLERADGKEYIFAKTKDNIYINLKEMKIESVANEYVIPINSFIAFEEDVIRYYSAEDDTLTFKEINDVDYSSQVSIKDMENKEDTQLVEKQCSYEELLTKLEIIENAKNDVENSQEKIEKEETFNEEEQMDEKEENKEEVTEPIEPENSEEIQDNTEFVKPEVTAEEFEAEVYSAKSRLYIKDPAGRIIEAPTFEIYKDGKIYLRRIFKASGEIQITGLVPDTEYEIVGKYIYLNEENKKIENTFFKGTIKTKGYEALGAITLSKEEGEIFSNKIQIKNLKITSDINAEEVKGINQVEIETGEIKTVIKNDKVNELLQGKEVTIESSEGLKSNAKVGYKIRFYDKNGKELKVENNEGKSKTSKQKPTVRVSIKEQDIVSVTLGLRLTNKDKVKLENYKYVVTKPNGEIVKKERLSENEREIKLEDLDQNQYYKITIYADFNLNDNKGVKEKEEIGNLVFATKPIATLGSLELKVENKETTNKSAKIAYKIDEERTDKRLIQILNELTIKIVEEQKNPEENAQKEDNIIYTNTLAGKEIKNLQLGETKELNYEQLKSNTTYKIEITGNVELGNTKEEVPVTYTYNKFITLKIPAKVEIKNQFVTGNLIDLDVKIKDKDNSVLNNKVRVELRDEKNNLIDLQEIETNKEYVRKTYEKLEENKIYTLSFYADQYNEGSTDETYKINYLIKRIEILTEPGISGSIGISELSRKSTGKNLVDMSSEINWLTNNFNTWGRYGYEYEKESNTMKLYSETVNSRIRHTTYDLKEYKNKTLTMSFQAKIGNNSSELSAYIVKSRSGYVVRKLEGLNKDMWTTYTVTIQNDIDGYVGFKTTSVDDDGYKELLIKDLQIELGDQKTNYEKFKYEMVGNFQVNLEDRRDEIATNNYYIRILENDKVLINEENKLDEENKIENLIKNYELNENNNYTILLVVNVNGREYVLDEYNFDTKNSREIKGISTVQEYLMIQQKGEYIILNDLELSGRESEYRFGTYINAFNGIIDFNGKKITVHTEKQSNAAPLFYTIGREGKIKNIVIDYYIDSKNVNSIQGLFNNNYGIVENIQINLKECTDTERQSVTLMGWGNFGTINNFIVNSEKSLLGNRDLSLVVRNNYGTIKNGYIYGENIKALHSIGNQSRNIGGIAVINAGGIVENIYSLVNIETSGESGSKDIGNITSNNNNVSYVKNVYSVGYGNTQEFEKGPTVYNVDNPNNIENVYYFADRVFNNTNNHKVTPLALWDNNFQNNVLNSENSFNVDALISNGYYPMLDMPKCMPNQKYLELPKVEDKDLPDILTSEILEASHNTAKIKITVNNPSAETIKSIKVKNVEAKIESQEYANGKSEVIVLLENPVLFISKYDITEITTKGAYNQEYTRKYKENERIINVDFYKEINSIEDWKDIKKSTKENYILMTDLDFKNEGNNIVIDVILSGKIDGNNHIIKNIIINNKPYLIYHLQGNLQNLNIVNCQINAGNSTALIGYCDGVVNNCNIKKIILNSKNVSGESRQGAFAGSLRGRIENCTVTDVEIISNNIFRVLAGGIAGYMSNGKIYNCYVQNLMMNTTECSTYKGIGGIIGCMEAKAEVINCYAVGDIDTDGINIGGIVGRTTDSSLIKNSISKVNITGSPDIFAGIAGTIEDTNTYVENSLSLGDLYTSRNNVEGKSIAYSTKGVLENNYYYEEQKINGIKKGKVEEKSLSFNELLNLNTYTEKIKLSDNYNYDKVNQGMIPKLMDTEKRQKLPNQNDIYIRENNKIEIVNIKTEKDAINSIVGQIIISNPEEIEITNVNINSMNVTIDSIKTEKGVTYINFKAIPNKYYDTYKLDKIYYKEDDITKELNTESRINQQFYKEIYSYEDWQAIEDGTYQNYRLMNDLDFSNKGKIKTNVTIGRLEGANDGKIKTIKNINLEFNNNEEALIDTIMYNMENIKFDSISINNLRNNGDYCNLIGANNGNIVNTEFSNISVNTANMSYVGIIGNNSGYLNNIKMLDINITGKNRIAGLVCYSSFAKGIENISAERINILASGNDIGRSNGI